MGTSKAGGFLETHPELNSDILREDLMAAERKSTTGKVTDPLLNLVPRHPIQGFGTSAPWSLRDRPSDVQVD